MIDTRTTSPHATTERVYNGEFAWPTVILGLVSTALYFTIPFAVHDGLISTPTALAVMCVALYLAYTPLHESVHRAVSGSHHGLLRINDAVGHLTATVLAVPMIAHRYEHLAHHRFANDSEFDPDFAWANIRRTPLRSTVDALLANYRFFLSPRHGLRPAKDVKIFWLEVVGTFGVRLIIMGFTDPLTTLFLFAASGLIGTLVLGFFFSFLVHQPFKSIGRHVDTGTIIAPGAWNGLVTWLWMFQNYHSVHHLYPRVPFYRYRQVFTDRQAEMIAQGSPIYRLGLRGLRRVEHDLG
jgi:beta-carotene hydroxylase